MITHGQVRLKNTHRQRLLVHLGSVCMNVSAGIGVVGVASPMLQEIFGGSLLGHPEVSFTALSNSQRGMVAAIAAEVFFQKGVEHPGGQHRYGCS